MRLLLVRLFVLMVRYIFPFVLLSTIRFRSVLRRIVVELMGVRVRLPICVRLCLHVRRRLLKVCLFLVVVMLLAWMVVFVSVVVFVALILLGVMLRLRRVFLPVLLCRGKRRRRVVLCGLSAVPSRLV